MKPSQSALLKGSIPLYPAEQERKTASGPALRPEARPFHPRPAQPTTPPQYDFEYWKSFTLSAYPTDPCGLFPKTYSVAYHGYRMGSACIARFAGEEIVGSTFDLDKPRPEDFKALLANLAPAYASSPTDYLDDTRTYCPPRWETYSARFYARTHQGLTRLETLHDLCRQFAHGDRAAVLLLRECNDYLNVFPAAEDGALQTEIARMQGQLTQASLEYWERRRAVNVNEGAGVAGWCSE